VTLAALGSIRRDPGAVGGQRRAADFLQEARAHERGGCLPEAIDRYASAVAEAERTDDDRVLAEALRRLAVVRHRRNESADARTLCQRSYDVARRLGDTFLAAEALNTLGGLALMAGALEEARETFRQALALGGTSAELHARVQQNLGILANIQGDLDEALTRYERSLGAYRALGDEHGCALAYHNLGMISADRRQLDEAARFFTESHEIAVRAGDVHLQALCLVNHAEVHVARQQFEEARRSAESALCIFDQLGAGADKAEAYRMIGVVYRETGRTTLAESRLRSAIELARTSGSLLGEAEASRELAVLYETMGRNQEALALLTAAHRLFRRLDARVDLVHVDGKVADLEGTYLAAVRSWGMSIESSDSYTFGHCERVAEYAVAVAETLGLDEDTRTTIRLGAYLHDLGKVRVPHEILNKPGPLTREETDVVRMHPIWGIELLAGVEFPWDIKSIVRWHHEKYDGTGYPDRLRGDEIPVAAQVVGIADVLDALTTTRPYRPALSHDNAVAEIARCGHWWSPRVDAAFHEAFNSPAGLGGRVAAGPAGVVGSRG
jgi:putative nucleotidyltransferase with HDIG domain